LEKTIKTGKKIVLFMFTLFFSFFFPGQAFPLSCQDSLRGLEGVEVLVEELKDDLENYNVTSIQIQTDVESRLRTAGIKVLSKEENERLQPLRKPYLYLRINSVKAPGKREGLFFNIEIALNQQVFIREQLKTFKISCFAPTWYKTFLGVAGWKNISEIRDLVQGLTDKFIEAYQAANQNK
jgi:hypothetical protein